jgi:hypothetical protein
MNHKGGPKGGPNVSKKIVIEQSKWHLQQQPPKKKFFGHTAQQINKKA